MNNPPLLLQVDITEVGRLLFSGPCTRLVAPAAHGEVCILPRHAPLLARLRPGELRFRTEAGEEQLFFVSGGYLEVRDSAVTVLADQMLRSGEIDRQAALAARQRAEELLRGGAFPGDRDPAKLDLAKAIAQLRVLEHAEIQRLKTRHS